MLLRIFIVLTIRGLLGSWNVAHFYLITTGHAVISQLKAMIAGRDAVKE